MKIKMLSQSYGTEFDEKKVRIGQKLYLKDGVYEVSEDLGNAFLSSGKAESISVEMKQEQVPALEEQESKADLGGAPKNKAKKKRVRSK